MPRGKPKQIQKTPTPCVTCGKTFYAQRKSAKFCSDACRIANHRVKVAHDEKLAQFAAMIADLGHALYVKESSYEAAIELTNLRRAIDMFLPSTTRWWHCDNCHNSTMVFIPREDSCSCGKAAKWYMMNTST
jgi:hypothetical protein